MPYCRAHADLVTGGELNCHLDEGHETLLEFHYDKIEDKEWREGRVPAPVPYTPTGPIPKIKVEKTWKLAGQADKVTL